MPSDTPFSNFASLPTATGNVLYSNAGNVTSQGSSLATFSTTFGGHRRSEATTDPRFPVMPLSSPHHHVLSSGTSIINEHALSNGAFEIANRAQTLLSPTTPQMSQNFSNRSVPTGSSESMPAYPYPAYSHESSFSPDVVNSMAEQRIPAQAVTTPAGFPHIPNLMSMPAADGHGTSTCSVGGQIRPTISEPPIQSPVPVEYGSLYSNSTNGRSYQSDVHRTASNGISTLFPNHVPASATSMNRGGSVGIDHVTQPNGYDLMSTASSTSINLSSIHGSMNGMVMHNMPHTYVHSDTSNDNIGFDTLNPSEPRITNSAVPGSGELSKIRCQWRHCKLEFVDPAMLMHHVSEEHIGRRALGHLSLRCEWADCHVVARKRDHIISHVRLHIPYWPLTCSVSYL
jgi:hypothetical protein